MECPLCQDKHELGQCRIWLTAGGPSTLTTSQTSTLQQSTKDPVPKPLTESPAEESTPSTKLSPGKGRRVYSPSPTEKPNTTGAEAKSPTSSSGPFDDLKAACLEMVAGWVIDESALNDGFARVIHVLQAYCKEEYWKAFRDGIRPDTGSCMDCDAHGHYARGYCKLCYMRHYNAGDFK